MAEGLYGLLSAWSHPNFVEQVLGDMRIPAGGGTLQVPTPNVELSRITVLSTARLLRVVVELLVQVTGAVDRRLGGTGQPLRIPNVIGG